MALDNWVGRIDRRSRLNSVQLDSRGALPYRLVSFSSHGWHSFTREGAPHAGWAQWANHVIRPRWMDVPLVFARGQGITDTTKLLHPRQQYRKAQPAKKTYALAGALRSSAEAIRAKRG